VPALTVRRLEEHVQRPLHIDLQRVTSVPFAEHPLTELLPAFSAAINGHAVTAHVDTGGTYLVMGPERARALGIDLFEAGRDRAHLNLMRVEICYGIAERFVLGDAVLHNVPVDVLSTLTGDSDLIIFGTNFLEWFLSTVDCRNRRLILSKRGDPAAAEAHRAMLPTHDSTVPFHLWGDHFMFARGGLGARRGLNFFVDSGLTYVVPDGSGGSRQASFATSKKRLKQWGISAADIRQGHFESPAPLTLGPIGQERPLIVAAPAGEQNFGGVRIDGLISHGFLKRYMWTIDFDTREYRFANAC
jgi:hypothetical protein